MKKVAKPAKRKTVPLLKFQQDPKNANRGTDIGREAIRHSLKEYGSGRSIVVDRNDTIIAGNKACEQALALGKQAIVVETEGDEMVVVKRLDLDLSKDPRAKALALADNRAAEVSLEWDPNVVNDMLKELDDDEGIKAMFANLVTSAASEDKDSKATFPLAPVYDEGYHAVVVVTGSDQEWAAMQTALKLERAKDRHGGVGLCHVITAKKLLDLLDNSTAK